MDWSIHVGTAAELRADLALEGFRDQNGAAGTAARRLSAAFDNARFGRCAYGTEFCEHLIPDLGSLRETYIAARVRGLDFTFLTPYVSEAGINKLRQLLDCLQQLGPAEVSFNDWGVLHMLRREFPALVPVQGRLLNKSLRDPRVMGVYADSQAASAAAAATLAVLQRSNLDCSSYTRLLARFGVTQVEMDLLPQQTHLELPDGLSVSVYFPFGFIATSRSCMAAGLHCRKPDKFQPGAPCRHECQTHLIEYAYTNSPFGNRDQRFWLKGNTYFYTHTDAMISEAIEQAQAGRVSRFVFQPSLPMLWAA
jgi:hypothetical protein